MNRASKATVLMGVGLMLFPLALSAQTSAELAPGAPAGLVAIPPEQQATRAQLDNLFEVMHVRDQIAAMAKTMPQVMQKAFSDQVEQMEKEHPEMTPGTEEQKQTAAKIMGKYMTRVMTLYPPDEMIEDMASLYQKHLSARDVDAMIGFYSSPAGQDMLAMVPVIMKEYMPMVMKKMQERIQPAVDELTKERAEALKPKVPSADQPSSN